jgi:CheY-like chemotaxis protein
MNWNRILLVEDDIDDQAFFGMAVRALNPDLKCVTVNNGVEALEEIERSQPDVIFLDLNMPRMNGFDFLEAYRKSNSDVPVVILTTSNDDRDIRKAGEMGAQAFITKPADFNRLKRVLSDVLASDISTADSRIRKF